VKEPPAEILRRLRPIPTSVGPPRTRPRDIVGVTPHEVPCRVEVMEAAAPVLLLFLSAACLGCQDLWEGLGQLRAGLGAAARLAVVTRSPGSAPDDTRAIDLDAAARDAGTGGKCEDAAAVARLADRAPADVAVVMSTEAFGHYRVAGPPFLVVVDAASVRTESVAWGVEQTLRLAERALAAE
jgi:hypothetical protein